MSSASALDELLFAVADVQRRRILLALRENNPQQLQTIVHGDADGGEIDSQRRLIRLHHDHLPRLADAGFIHWEPKTGSVEKGPRFEEIRPLLELLCASAGDLPGEGE